LILRLRIAYDASMCFRSISTAFGKPLPRGAE